MNSSTSSPPARGEIGQAIEVGELTQTFRSLKLSRICAFLLPLTSCCCGGGTQSTELQVFKYAVPVSPDSCYELPQVVCPGNREGASTSRWLDNNGEFDSSLSEDSMQTRALVLII